MSKQSWADMTEEDEREEREEAEEAEEAEREEAERIRKEEEKREKKRKKKELEKLYGKKKKKKKEKEKHPDYRKKTADVAPESSAAAAASADSAPESTPESSVAESSVAESSKGESKYESSAAAAPKPMTALERMVNRQSKAQAAYRKRAHQAAALKQLKGLNTDFYASGDAFIKPGESVFREFPLFSRCRDIHFHVYSGGAGIRFRFVDGSELQFNDGDAAGKDGVVLTKWRVKGAQVRDLVLNRQLSAVSKAEFAKLVNTQVSRSWNFKDTEAGKAVKELHRMENLADFLEQIELYVLVVAAAGTKDGSKGGGRKTRKRKRKGGKRKTRKRKKKRKTRRKRKYRKKRTKRRR